MHTVRNRLASRPPTSSAIPAGCLPPGRHDLSYVPRGSMALPLAVAEESGLIESRQTRRRNPKGKKARKAAARLASVREAEALAPAPCEVAEKPRRAAPAAKKGKPKPKARAKTGKRKAARPEQLPAIPAASPVVGTYSPPATRTAAPPALALTLPVRPEPLVLAAPAEPVRLLTFDTVLERGEAASMLPAAPEPLVDAPALPAEPEVTPEPEPEPAIALAAMAAAPLPRARALVPARRQGLIDVIAFLLRDSGRRLARWSARRHKTRAEQAALRRAEARQINLQRELEALEALDALRRAKG